MITRTTNRSGARVTFTVAADAAVSVVGDFNGWDPAAHPLRKRADGMRSTTISLAPGTYAFRYLAHGGLFFDDPDADRFDSNEHGGIDGVIVVAEGAEGEAGSAAKKSSGAAKKAADAKPKKAAKRTARSTAKKSSES